MLRGWSVRAKDDASGWRVRKETEDSLDETVGIELVTVLDAPVLDDDGLKKMRRRTKSGRSQQMSRPTRRRRDRGKNEQQPSGCA